MKKGSDLNEFPVDYLGKLERLRPIDDDFMRILLRKNLPLSEKILRVIMDMPDLHIISVETQADLKVIGSRSLELDVLCESDKKQIFNLEVEKNAEGATPKRARYHASVIDSKQLKPKTPFTTLKDVYIVFITEKDIRGKGLPKYYARVSEDRADLIPDGTCIVFANAQYHDDTEFGALMSDFLECHPERMKTKEMRDACQFYKRTAEGKRIMCSVFEELRAEGRAEGRAEERRNTEKERMKAKRERLRADQALKENARLQLEISMLKAKLNASE